MDQFTMRHEPIKQCQIADKDFPITLQTIDNTVLMGMSDYSLKWLDLETMKPIWDLPKAHNKRIQQLIVSDGVAITCSNDQTIKIFDLNSRKLVHTFNSNDEFYSVARSKHILAGGAEGKIMFYDMNVMKWRSSFDASQNDEISSLTFNPAVSTQLLSSSTDGLLVVYDLTQTNEEEALKMMFRFEQPLNSAGYWGNLCYGVTTTNSITIIDIEHDKKITEFATVSNNEFNEEYLIDVHTDQQFTYFIGKNEQITQKNNNQTPVALLKTNQKEQIRHIKKVANQYLLFSENGSVEILAPQQYKPTILEECNDFIEDDVKPKRKQY